MKSEKTWDLKKNEISKKKRKKENKTFPELKNFWPQSVSVSDKDSLRKCQNPGNVKAR